MNAYEAYETMGAALASCDVDSPDDVDFSPQDKSFLVKYYDGIVMRHNKDGSSMIPESEIDEVETVDITFTPLGETIKLFAPIETVLEEVE